MRRYSLLALPIAAVTILAGCSGSPEPAPVEPAPSVSPEIKETDAVDPADPSETEPPVIAECAVIGLEDGAIVSGEDFSACIIGFSMAAGTGSQRVTSDVLTGTVDFVYSTSPQAYVVAENPPMELLITDGGTWQRGAGGWESNEGTKIIGDAWRAFAQPAVAFGLLAGSDYILADDEWIETANGTEVPAWKFTAIDPIGVGGVAVESLEMWLTTDLVPLRQESVSSFESRFRGTTVNEYYDWGVDIELPVVD